MARANIFGRHHPARALLDLPRGHGIRYDGTSDGGSPSRRRVSLRLSVAGCILEVEKCDFDLGWNYLEVYTFHFI